ncbi:MAG: hypothetical protein ABIV36_25620 [Sphingobium limneticum]
MTAKLDLAASRNIAWSPTIDLFYYGDELPLDGATIVMQVRLYPGASGAPIHATSPIVFEDLPPADEEARRCLRIFPSIAQAALIAFPTGLNKPEPGEADAYSFDIIITYADALQDKLALGRFLLEPGVTLP